MKSHDLVERLEVEAALGHQSLEPPPPSPALGTGPTLHLRERMARFAGGEKHAPRRIAVVAVLDSIDLSEVDVLARRETRSRIAANKSEPELVATVVPVTVVSRLIRVTPTTTLAEDVALIAGSIGGGAQADEGVDVASTRVVEACGGWTDVGLAKASLLYQAYGATRSLIMTIADCPSDSQRSPAVLVTERIAVDQLTLCGRDIDPGDLVVIGIGPVGLEFGHGSHSCPGRELAELIANAVSQEIAEAEYGSTHD